MSEPAVEARGLRKAFGKVQALDGLSLTVPAGSVLGLLGPNGSGKTTTVSILATSLRPDAGQGCVDGLDVVTQAAQVRRVIGLAGQFAAVDPNLTGRENLRLVGRLSRVGRRQARIRADELLNRTMDRIEETSDAVHRTVISPVRQLSGVIQGLSAGLEFLLGGERRRRHDVSVPQDEMFI